MLELVGAELEVNLGDMPVVVIVGNTPCSPVQRIAAMVITADWLDWQATDIAPGEPESYSWCAVLPSRTPVPGNRKISGV